VPLCVLWRWVSLSCCQRPPPRPGNACRRLCRAPGFCLNALRPCSLAPSHLGSPTLRADATETLLCSWLSLALLVDLVLNATVNWWWAADPLVGWLSPTSPPPRASRPSEATTTTTTWPDQSKEERRHDEGLPLSRHLRVRAVMPTDNRLACTLQSAGPERVTGAAAWVRGPLHPAERRGLTALGAGRRCLDNLIRHMVEAGTVMWWNDSSSSSWWFVMPLLMVAFWVAVIWLAVSVLRRLAGRPSGERDRPERPKRSWPGGTPRERSTRTSTAAAGTSSEAPSAQETNDDRDNRDHPHSR
jgi:hypothetical protein